MSDEIETAMSFNGIGTTVITNVAHKTFQIRMSSDAKEWVNNPTQIIDAKSKTIGEANRQWLHDKLDAFLDAYK